MRRSSFGILEILITGAVLLGVCFVLMSIFQSDISPAVQDFNQKVENHYKAIESPEEAGKVGIRGGGAQK